MVLKRELLESIPLHTHEQKCGANVYQLEDHGGENGLSLISHQSLGPQKKLLQVFPITY
jgi:hypothetical protein